VIQDIDIPIGKAPEFSSFSSRKSESPRMDVPFITRVRDLSSPRTYVTRVLGRSEHP
jgi:hypothetical protein